ncbi:MAG: hypothetical protein VCB07_09065 [Gammaproteobacteria bacterium]
MFARAVLLEFGSRKLAFREGHRDNYAFFSTGRAVRTTSSRPVGKKLKVRLGDGVHTNALLQSRRLTARTKTRVTVLPADRGYVAVKVSEINTADDGDWMMRMLQSELFSRVLDAKIQ